MRIETIEISKINPAVYNPRKDLKPGDPEYDKLKKSILEFDMVEPLVWNTQTKNLVGGHQRLKVLQELGIEKVEVSVVDLSPVKEKALNIALNKIQGEWDFPMLKDLLQELDTGDFDMEITGFDELEIENLMTQFHVPEEGLTDDDAIPEHVETVCKTGDLWQLGEHRLLCGDATKKEDVERLMGGEKADMVFTDPPYGINIDTAWLTKINLKHKSRPNRSDAKLANDDGSLDLSHLWEYKYWFTWGFPYIACPQMTGWLVWDKWPDQTGSLDAKLGNPCEMALTNYSTGFRLIRLLWRGYFRAKGEERFAHPTQKPLGIIEPVIAMRQGAILDPFGGSGSTLIACEKLGRRCFMMEIDEHYCDVIITRWQDFTGQKAVKLNDNQRQ